MERKSPLENFDPPANNEERAQRASRLDLWFNHSEYSASYYVLAKSFGTFSLEELAQWESLIRRWYLAMTEEEAYTVINDAGQMWRRYVNLMIEVTKMKQNIGRYHKNK